MAHAVPLLVLITGEPGTGKSTLAQHCAAELGMPVLARDNLKEILFDTLGWSDREWSRKLGAASYDLLFHCAELLLRTHSSFIIDNNFSSASGRDTICRLVAGYPHQVVEFHCTAPAAVAIERFRQRAEVGNRHPGHVDAGNIAEFAANIGQHPAEPIVAGGIFYFLNTAQTDAAASAATALALLREMDVHATPATHRDS